MARPQLYILSHSDPLPEAALASYSEHLREYVGAARQLSERIDKEHSEECGHAASSSTICLLTEAATLAKRICGRDVTDGERYVVGVALLSTILTAAAQLTGAVPVFGPGVSVVGLPELHNPTHKYAPSTN